MVLVVNPYQAAKSWVELRQAMERRFSDKRSDYDRIQDIAERKQIHRVSGQSVFHERVRGDRKTPSRNERFRPE